jgi:predicted AlkP superfamily phosphohydrolase/phosphomutase
MSGRVLVIGLDGVGFDRIEPWAAAGKLPTLAGLLRRGARGALRSTIPPVTGPAWASFLTGVNPGRHGVLEWTRRVEGSYESAVVTGRDVARPTLLDLASRAGKRVISVGLPLTHPPRPVNGVVVPGMPAPEGDRFLTHPPEAREALRQVAPHYRPFPECAHRPTRRGKTAELITSARARAAAATHFLETEAWDLGIVHFQETDKVQHDLLGRVGGGFDPILSVFQEVDHLLAGLLEIAREREATVVLLSDHGMGPQEGTFSVNTWLWQEGYLALKGDAAARVKRAAFRLGLTQRHFHTLGLFLYPLAFRLHLSRSFMDVGTGGPIARLISSLFLSLDDVDWSRTRAYSRAEVGHVCLNRVGREPQGIVSDAEAPRLVAEIMERLQRVVDPRTSEPLLGEVFRREEVYAGEHLAAAPEILFLPRDLRVLGAGASGFYSNRLFDRPQWRASHRMEGILIASGAPFRPQARIEGASLLDLLPNALYLLDLPIPADVEGTVWEHAYLPGTLAARPPRFEGAAEPATRGDAGEDEEAELRRRLSDLGYLS